jgi:hypothetical protein
MHCDVYLCMRGSHAEPRFRFSGKT